MSGFFWLVVSAREPARFFRPAVLACGWVAADDDALAAAVFGFALG